jgi:hypothetical protein
MLDCPCNWDRLEGENADCERDESSSVCTLQGFRSWIPIRMRGKSTRTPGRANCIFRSAGLVRTSHRENARYLNAQRFHARLVSLLHVSSNARGNLTLTVNSSDLVSGRRAPKVTIPAQSASLVAVWQRDCSLDCTTFKK